MNKICFYLLITLFSFTSIAQDMILGGAKDSKYLYTTSQRDGWIPGSLIWQMNSQNKHLYFDTRNLSKGQFLNKKIIGFNGGVFDGRYIYFIPNHDGRDYHGYILRYDTQSPFRKSSSWKTFDISSLNPNLTGFTGASIINGYLYLSPYFTGGHFSGRIPRYKLGTSFTNKSSWEYIDVSQLYPKAKGFYGTISHNEYIYFVPLRDGNQFHGRVIRYNTLKPFKNKESWDFLDLESFIPNASGFLGAVKTANHIYFLPFKKDKINYSGTIVRFNLNKDFKDSKSWDYLDLTNFDDRFTGYRSGRVFNGHLYMTPYKNDSEHGLALKLDLSKDWKLRNSWSLFDIEQLERFAHGFSSIIDFNKKLYFLRSHNDNGLRKAFIYTNGLDFSDSTSWSAFNFTRVNNQ